VLGLVIGFTISRGKKRPRLRSKIVKANSSLSAERHRLEFSKGREMKVKNESYLHNFKVGSSNILKIEMKQVTFV
jgi:hypothetical protein